LCRRKAGLTESESVERVLGGVEEEFKKCRRSRPSI